MEGDSPGHEGVRSTSRLDRRAVRPEVELRLAVGVDVRDSDRQVDLVVAGRAMLGRLPVHVRPLGHLRAEVVGEAQRLHHRPGHQEGGVAGDQIHEDRAVACTACHGHSSHRVAHKALVAVEAQRLVAVVQLNLAKIDSMLEMIQDVSLERVEATDHGACATVEHAHARAVDALRVLGRLRHRLSVEVRAVRAAEGVREAHQAVLARGRRADRGDHVRDHADRVVTSALRALRGLPSKLPLLHISSGWHSAR